MYKLYKRKNSRFWWIEITLQGQGRVRTSSKTSNKAEAEELARKLDTQLWREHQLGETPGYTWEQAVVRWRRESEHKKSLETDIHRLRVISPLLAGKELSSLKRDLVDDVITELAEERGLSNASQNRYLSLVRSIVRKAAYDWGWLESCPVYRKRNEPKRRVRWIQPYEAMAIIEELPDWHKNPIHLGFVTGLRKSNLYGLTWSQVSLKRRCAWIYGDETKGKKDLAIPLNNTALGILKEQRGNHDHYVFGGINPPRNESWNIWCAKAGVEDFRIHDVRHTWASWHVMSGTTLHELMELGGWSSYEMVLKYAHLSPDHLKSAAQNIDTKLAHSAGSLLRSAVEKTA